MKFKFVFLLALCPFLLANCSYIKNNSYVQNRNKAYLKATSTAPLRIPPGVPSNQFKNLYPVPDRNYPESAKDVSIEPPGLSD